MELGLLNAMQYGMSDLPLKADMCGATRNVRYGPIVDTAPRATEGAPCRDLSEIQSDDLILFPSAPSPLKAKKSASSRHHCTALLLATQPRVVR